MKNIAILLSGGVGTRISSDIPKQYVRVGGRMMVTYALQTLMKSKHIDGICIVADESWRDEIEADVRECDPGDTVLERDIETAQGKMNQVNRKLLGFADSGENRQLSILNAMDRIYKVIDDSTKNGVEKAVDTESYVETDKASDTVNASDITILIHDAARPYLSEQQIADCYAALSGHDGVMPVLPMKDTVYLSEDGHTVTSLIDRSQIYAGQAPELYRLAPYYEATKALLPDEILSINGSTEPAIRAGLDVVMIPGDEANVKITTDEDMKKFREMCQDI